MNLKLVESSDQGEHDGERGDLKGAGATAGYFSDHASSGIGAGRRYGTLAHGGATGGACPQALCAA